MEFRAGKGAVWILRILIIAVALVLTGVLLFLPYGGMQWLRAVGIIFGAVLAALGMWYASQLSRSVCGSLDSSSARIVYGVLWRRETVVPLDALRTYEVWAPPLHRLFHCRTVILRFAGGSAWMPLLSRRDAERLIEQLECAERGR